MIELGRTIFSAPKTTGGVETSFAVVIILPATDSLTVVTITILTTRLWKITEIRIAYTVICMWAVVCIDITSEIEFISVNA